MLDRPVTAETSFSAFYEASFGELARYAARLLGDPAAADDLAQEALARTYARWPLLRDPRPYAYRTVHNLSVDAVRRDRRRQALAPDREVHTPGPDTTVRDAVDRLPERLRSVVVLHYWADLPLAEVGRVLRRPTGTVARRLSEARALLARSLEDS